MIASQNIKMRRQRARVGRVTIAYEIAGEGEPIILIHGLSGSGAWWSRNVGALAERFRVHVVDLIGFGASRGGQAFVLQEAARHLAGWMEQLGIEHAAVVGHSMGGFVAVDLAAEFPDRVARLVLVDAAALPFQRRYLKHALGLMQASRYLPLDFWPTLVRDALRAGPLTIGRAAFELFSADISEKLERVRAPTLVIWGEYDRLVPIEFGEQLCRLLPTNRQLMVIKGAGHNPMWDRPKTFNDVLIDFLTHGGGGRRTEDD